MRLVRDDARPVEDGHDVCRSYGLNLTNDGRVFFTSREGLVLSDTNEKLDAYQWNGGLEVGKISTGRSSFDSRFSRSAQTARTPSSSPATSSSPRTKTAAP